MWSTIFAGAIGGFEGYLTHRLQNPTYYADRKLDKIMKNPKSAQKYSVGDLKRIADKSSWNSGVSKNKNGFRVYKHDDMIRVNYNGTRFDANHFYGVPYWVVSNGKTGKHKFIYLYI